MEWKNLRKWMILMLLAVDLFLAGNLLWQMYEQRQGERTALLDAAQVAQRRGILLDTESLLRLPVSPESFSAQRSTTLEQQAAATLLGEELRPEEPGGGVSIYRGEQGRLSFRRGGALELELAWQGSAPEDWAALLAPAGLSMEDVQLTVDGEGITLTQRQQGAVIVNSRLTCTMAGDTALVRGRWLLSRELTASRESLSRAQLVLDLCDLLEERGLSAADGLEFGYSLQSGDTQSLLLEPVWIVTCGTEQLLLSCLTGDEMVYQPT